MRTSATLMAGISLLACSGAGSADEAPLPPPTGFVYAGVCLDPALGEPAPGKESALLAGLAATVLPSLISKGFDWIGAKLTTLGEDERTVVGATRASMTRFDSHTCLQLVRESASGSSVEQIATAAGIPKESVSERLRLDLKMKVDFFVELWVRPSPDGSMVSLTPALLYYPKPLAKDKNGVKDTAVTITTKIAPKGSDGLAGSWALPKSSPPSVLQVLIPWEQPVTGKIYGRSLNDLNLYCESACTLASPWYANPWESARIPVEAAPAPVAPAGTAIAVTVKAPGAMAASYNAVATNVGLQWTEIRAGSKFFKEAAALFNAAKPTLQATAEQTLIKDANDKAAVARMNETSTALAAYATAVSAAETERAESYCAAVVPKANWLALTAQLRAKQISANSAAIAADQSKPFPTPLTVSPVYDKTVCP